MVASAVLMDFRVLGPLEVLDGDRELDLGAPKQRALLAILLLHANEVVSNDRLIDDLWEDEPPETAQKALQVYVSQLRKLVGKERLLTRGRGYMLTVAEGELDLDRFRSLVADGDPAHALALWRGEPLQGFADRGFAAPDIARIDELRLSAVEERNDQQLVAGHHSELVGELESLVRQYPLRERLRCQLMLALYRSGRQAEALEAYQDARRALTDELGIDPGRELRELQQQILNQDPALQPPISAPADGGVDSGAGPRRRRRQRALLAAGLLLAGVAIVVAVVVETRGSSGSPVVVRSNSVALIDPRTNAVVDDIMVGSSPSSVAVGEGAVWVLNGDDRTVSRIDLETKSVRTIAAGSNPSDLAVGNGAVWVVNGYAASVLRVDPDTGAITSVIRLPRVKVSGNLHAAIASGRDEVWVTTWEVGIESSTDFVWRIDPSDNRIIATFSRLGGDIAIDRAQAWIAGSRLTGIDSRSGKASTAWVFVPEPYLLHVATGAGGIWVVSVLDGTLSKFDLFSATLQRTITVGSGPAGITTAAGSVWVANAGDGTVARIDPLTVRIIKTIGVGGSPGGVAVSPEGIWVTVT